jgi:hypothetical protein
MSLTNLASNISKFYMANINVITNIIVGLILLLIMYFVRVLAVKAQHKVIDLKIKDLERGKFDDEKVEMQKVSKIN